jgi:hypothetical protein
MSLALVFAAAAQAATLTVDADALRVRAAPDADAEVVAHLRMGTRVTTDHTDGEWVQVHLQRAPHTRGWVHRAFLRDGDLDLAEIRRAALAGDEEAVRRWLALDPADPRARELRMSQGNAGASGVAAWEEAPTWVAACGHSGTVLLGSVDDEGAFTAAVGGHDAAALQALGEDLAGAAWYAHRPPGGPLLGTPFPRPEPQAVVEVLADEGSPLRLDLGPCPGGIVSTRPLTGLTPEGVALETLMAAAAPLAAQLPDAPSRVGARRLHPDLPLLEVTAEAPTTVDTEDRIEEPAVEGRVGLAGPDGRLVGARGGLGLDTDVTWVELSGTRHPTLIGVSNLHGPLDSSLLLYVVRLTPEGPEVDTRTLSLWEGGC